MILKPFLLFKWKHISGAFCTYILKGFFVLFSFIFQKLKKNLMYCHVFFSSRSGSFSVFKISFFPSSWWEVLTMIHWLQFYWEKCKYILLSLLFKELMLFSHQKLEKLEKRNIANKRLSSCWGVVLSWDIDILLLVVFIMRMMARKFIIGDLI